MNTGKNMRSGIQNLALLKSDYEGGLCSRQKIAENHSISAVTLWRISKKEGWEYGKKRDQLMEEVSQASMNRLMSMRSDVLEEHALTLSLLREEIVVTEDMKELKRLSSRLDAVLECIKAERLCFGLPSEIHSAA
jgi:hypothetical protein